MSSLESPTVEDLSEFLSDQDAGVRRTAVDVLTEHLPDEYGPTLLAALGDVDAGVRAAAADGVRELVEVLPDPAAARTFLTAADPVVRAAAVYLLSSRKVGDAAHFRRSLDDPDHRVRIAVANALGTLGEGAPTIRILIADRDPLVRAAALAALGAGGVIDADLTTVERALAESAWQVRQGAVRALAGVGTTAAEWTCPNPGECGYCATSGGAARFAIPVSRSM